jgi:hypothetical protein
MSIALRLAAPLARRGAAPAFARHFTMGDNLIPSDMDQQVKPS